MIVFSCVLLSFWLSKYDKRPRREGRVWLEMEETGRYDEERERERESETETATTLWSFGAVLWRCRFHRLVSPLFPRPAPSICFRLSSVSRFRSSLYARQGCPLVPLDSGRDTALHVIQVEKTETERQDAPPAQDSLCRLPPFEPAKSLQAGLGTRDKRQHSRVKAFADAQ